MINFFDIIIIVFIFIYFFGIGFIDGKDAIVGISIF